MSYQTERDFYKLWELDIPATAGNGPFISENTVTRIDGGQRLEGASANRASISQNNVYPYKGGDILRVNFAAKLPNPGGSGDSAFLGIIGNKSAGIGALNQAIGFWFNDSSQIRAAIIDSNGVTEELTGIDLVDTWKEFQIDLYTGVYSQSAPAVSKGGIGNIKFSVGNDQGLLRPVGYNTMFDMSQFSSAGFQIGLIAESSNAFDVDVKFVAVEHRNLPADA